MSRFNPFGVLLTFWAATALPAIGGILPSQEMHEFHETAVVRSWPARDGKVGSGTTGLLVDCRDSIGQIEPQAAIVYLRLVNFRSWNADLTDLFRKLPNLRYCLVEGDTDNLGQEWVVLSTMPSLRYLKFDLRRLESLPAWFAQLRQVAGIDLSGNRLARVPPELLSLEQLKELDLSENDIQVVDSSFDRMTSLQRINLSHNSIVAISDATTAPPGLRELELDSNKLEAFPATFTAAACLERLRIENNYFDRLPATWLARTALKRLTISRFVQGIEEVRKARPDLRITLVGE